MGIFGGNTPKDTAKKVALGTAKLTGKAIVGTTKLSFKAAGKGVTYFVPDAIKSKIARAKPGRCVSCNKPLVAGKGGVVNGDNVHKKCLNTLLTESVSTYEAAIQHGIQYDRRGKNMNGVRHESCGCNTLNLRHSPHCPAAPHEFMPGKKPNS